MLLYRASQSDVYSPSQFHTSTQYSYPDKFSTTPKSSFFQMCKENWRRKEDCKSEKSVLNLSLMLQQKDELVVKKQRKKYLLRVYKCSVILEQSFSINLALMDNSCLPQQRLTNFEAALQRLFLRLKIILQPNTCKEKEKVY